MTTKCRIQPERPPFTPEQQDRVYRLVDNLLLLKDHTAGPAWYLYCRELIDVIEAVEAERNVCWHCGDVLEPQGRPHCEHCPPDGDCDIEGCTAPGCVSAPSAVPLPEDMAQTIDKHVFQLVKTRRGAVNNDEPDARQVEVELVVDGEPGEFQAEPTVILRCSWQLAQALGCALIGLGEAAAAAREASDRAEVGDLRAEPEAFDLSGPPEPKGKP